MGIILCIVLTLFVGFSFMFCDFNDSDAPDTAYARAYHDFEKKYVAMRDEFVKSPDMFYVLPAPLNDRRQAFVGSEYRQLSVVFLTYLESINTAKKTLLARNDLTSRQREALLSDLGEDKLLNWNKWI